MYAKEICLRNSDDKFRMSNCTLLIRWHCTTLLSKTNMITKKREPLSRKCIVGPANAVIILNLIGMFTSRGNSLMFGPGLISTLGEHHRKQRKMLNPVFSPKHMRSLTPIFHPVAHELRDVFARHLREGHEEVDVLKWMSRAALEIIGRGGLGYSFNALDDRKKNKYNDAVKLLSYVAITFHQILSKLRHHIVQ